MNDLAEYEGGGTYFRKLEGDGGSDEDACGASLRSPKGHVIAHSSALMHGGHPTTKGVRYILVAFCTIAPEYAGWASRFYEHVNQKVDPGDEALVSSVRCAWDVDGRSCIGRRGVIGGREAY